MLSPLAHTNFERVDSSKPLLWHSYMDSICHWGHATAISELWLSTTASLRSIISVRARREVVVSSCRSM